MAVLVIFFIVIMNSQPVSSSQLHKLPNYTDAMKEVQLITSLV